MTKIWNNPANWPPVPEGWTPPEEGWIPPEGWTAEGYPPHPEGWEFWIEDEPVISRFSLPPLPPLPSPLLRIRQDAPETLEESKEQDELSFEYDDFGCYCEHDDNLSTRLNLQIPDPIKLSATQVNLGAIINTDKTKNVLDLVKNSKFLSRDSKDRIENHITKVENGYLAVLEALKTIMSERNLALDRVNRYEEDVHLYEALIVTEHTSNLETIVNGKQAELEEKQAQLEVTRDKVLELKGEADEAYVLLEYKEVFLYDYLNIAENSIELSSQLSLIKAKCKGMIRTKTAIIKPSISNKLTKDLASLMLKAYNSEAENAIIKSINTALVLNASKRIDEAFTNLNVLGETLSITVSDEYHALRKQEIELTFKFKERARQEKEEEHERRLQQKEDEAVEREANKLIETRETEKEQLLAKKKQLEAEEKKLERQLKKVSEASLPDTMSQLEKAAGHYSNAIKHADPELDQYKRNILILEERLDQINADIVAGKTTLSNKRAGYVYVISNIGAFGEGVVKIGLTRREKPFDRIKELSNASVPFVFDVHTMHYSMDAVTLEAEIHEHFRIRAVNRSNDRKEFFRVTPLEVKDYLAARPDGLELSFDTKYQATDYWKTISINTGVKFIGDDPTVDDPHIGQKVTGWGP